MKTGIFETVKAQYAKINWKLLIFLILIVNVKLFVKIAVIVLIYLVQFNFKPAFKGKSFNLFYLAIIGLSIIQLMILPLTKNYFPVWLVGVLYWVLCWLCLIQVKNFAAETSFEKIYTTIVCFFILNISVSFINLLLIVLETGAFNPYQYQGLNQKYFIGTGDYILGLSFDTSVTNAVISSFGLIYFFYHKNFLLSVLCLLCLLLTTSNLCILLTAGVLLFMIFVHRSYAHKSILVAFLAIIFCFMARISPQNGEYLAQAFSKLRGKEKVAQVKYDRLEDTPDSLLSVEDQKIKKIKLQLSDPGNSNRTVAIPRKEDATRKKIEAITEKPNVHTEFYQRKSDSTVQQKSLAQSAHSMYDTMHSDNSLYERMPGKLVAFRQTFQFLSEHTLQAIIGNGIGNFSSKNAFRVSGLNIAGRWPESYNYIHNNFKENHLYTYTYYFTKGESKHSALNLPSSVYNQLLGEYGIVGILVFALGYIVLIVRQYKALTYGVPLLILLLGVFFLDYWFEQLSIVVLFELLVLLDLKQTKEIHG